MLGYGDPRSQLEVCEVFNNTHPNRDSDLVRFGRTRVDEETQLNIEDNSRTSTRKILITIPKCK